MSQRTSVEIDGRQLSLSNLDKVLYPAAGLTKAAVIDYYARVAPVLLTHLAGRPLTMLRYPDGVDGERFFEKRCPGHRPDWVTTVALATHGDQPDKTTGEVVDHCDVADVASLTWVANLASLELHTSLARRPDTDAPTMAVFDLDPGAPAGMSECVKVALWLREVFDRMRLASCVKTSGSKGLQVYVPVNLPTTYERTREFALAVAQLIERVHGDAVVTNMSKDLRRGKVFIDWSQNNHHKTTVCAYSLRARERPTVSTPVTWGEVVDAAGPDAAESLRFEHAHVLERVGRHGDLFADAATLEQELPQLA